MNVVAEFCGGGPLDGSSVPLFVDEAPDELVFSAACAPCGWDVVGVEDTTYLLRSVSKPDPFFGVARYEHAP